LALTLIPLGPTPLSSPVLAPRSPPSGLDRTLAPCYTGLHSVQLWQPEEVTREMETEIVPAGPDCLPEYATVPVAFEIRALLRPILLDGGLGGITLSHEPVQPPYTKDYDSSEEGGPEAWALEWDLTSWAFFLLRRGGRCLGAAAVAYGTPAINLLDGRDDLAVLWDIRVRPESRRQGLGQQLFRQAADWARARGCRQLKVETQNINVPACRFYAAQGCRLGAIHRHAYTRRPELAHETMLLWYLEL
jgi:streptothricin acetyltransferase